MIIIGEKINGSIPAVAEAIANRDAELIKQRAIAQTNAGASYIDCCASVPEAEEVETLKWMIDCIQEVTDVPISVDSPSADVLVQAYKFCKKPGIFNSVSGEGDKIDKIFPVMALPENKDWQVIALLSDDTGIPKCAEDRLKVFEKIMAKAKDARQINRIFERMGYPAPVREDDTAKKANPRVRSENSFRERGNGARTSTEMDKPSVRAKMLELKKVSEQMARQARTIAAPEHEQR